MWDNMSVDYYYPGDKLISKGGRGDAAYFISSGAVEVITDTQRIRLGRGDVFGEIALLTGEPRTADVRALGYCNLLVLSRADFRQLIDKDPDLQRHIAATAEQRQAMNAEASDAEQRQPPSGA